MTARPSPDPFVIDETPIPLPSSLVGYDIEAAVAGLIRRCGRMEQIIEEQAKREAESVRGLLLGMIEVADALERVSDGRVGEGDGIRRDGIAATSRLLAVRLRDAGVIRMAIVGKTANPETADVVGSEVIHEMPDDIVVRDVTAGYWWNTNVLRRAAVIVSRSSEA